ncbi:hypothetical protein HPP92_023722 [Vanilla planifolia]|uniref:Uncharacterized protein n=1 Tax=Vanilla planifolia TaxID=51239 RepID=A0A835UAN5_VANPL|nr:hypothetical protein HPP92_023722 [Vanilla planifolia]
MRLPPELLIKSPYKFLRRLINSPASVLVLSKYRKRRVGDPQLSNHRRRLCVGGLLIQHLERHGDGLRFVTLAVAVVHRPVGGDVEVVAEGRGGEVVLFFGVVVGGEEVAESFSGKLAATEKEVEIHQYLPFGEAFAKHEEDHSNDVPHSLGYSGMSAT